MPQEFPYDMWWLPAVNGETESQPLTVLQFIMTTASLHLIRDEEKPFACLLGKPLCSPPGVACAREIEYHVFLSVIAILAAAGLKMQESGDLAYEALVHIIDEGIEEACLRVLRNDVVVGQYCGYQCAVTLA